MLQKLGMENVKSKFMTENPTVVQQATVPETHPKVKRSASIANRQKPVRSEMAKAAQPNVGTPKNSLRSRLNEVKEFDEKLEEERKLKAKKEANERIQKQKDYIKSLAEK